MKVKVTVHMAGNGIVETTIDFSNETELDNFNEAMSKRLARGEPISIITPKREVTIIPAHACVFVNAIILE